MNLSCFCFAHGVLQRNVQGFCQSILPFTSCRPGALVSVLRQSSTGEIMPVGSCHADARGNGFLPLDSLRTGGPYNLLIQEEEHDFLKIPDVLVGDVWLLGGQSNMCGAGKLREATPSSPAIRSFSFANRWNVAADRLHDLEMYQDLVYRRLVEQDKCIKGIDNNGSALGVGPGLTFAHDMLTATNVPQGLIPCAVGSSCLDEWNPCCKHGGADGNYYGALLDRCTMTGGKTRGLLWYQGEADTREERYQHYSEKTRQLFAAFNQDLGIDRIAMAQLGRYVLSCPGPKDARWASVREQQRLLQNRADGVAVVPTLDLEVMDGLHLTAAAAKTVGHRLAQAMLTLMHHPNAQQMPIELLSIISGWDSEIKAPTVHVRFRSLEGFLRSAGRPTGFLLHHQDAIVNQISYVELDRDTAIIHLSRNDRHIEPADHYQLSYGAICDASGTITDDAGRSLPGFGPLPIRRGSQPHI